LCWWSGHLHVNLHVLRLLFLSLFSALLAIALAVVCFLQLAVHKETTEQSLVVIEKQFVERSRLSDAQLRRLDHALANIRWNDRTLRQTHANLWQIGVLGFIALAALSFLSAFLINRRMREAAVSQRGHAS
jgi:hypothetical protein